MSTKYLLLKLAEEAAEVTQAAIKHRLYRTDATRCELELELGDLNAVTQLLFQASAIDSKGVNAQTKERYDRERKRINSR